eukprot:m.201301 g.201301  ORF g.201301 m.201301 type:complete len:613 (-) comp10676_c0_seq1:182-2020(-)
MTQAGDGRWLGRWEEQRNPPRHKPEARAIAMRALSLASASASTAALLLALALLQTPSAARAVDKAPEYFQGPVHHLRDAVPPDVVVPVEERLETRLKGLREHGRRRRREANFINLIFDRSFDWTAATRAVFLEARDTWEALIDGWLPVYSQSRNTPETFDITCKQLPFSDGIGGTIGVGGSTVFLLQAKAVAVSGFIAIDPSDMTHLLSSGRLYDAVLHEMAHALGFGPTWGDMRDSTKGKFIEPDVVDAYRAEFSQSVSGIPLEQAGGAGSAGGHWNELDFGWGPTGIADVHGRDLQNELMTAWLTQPTYLSFTTVKALWAAGYAHPPLPEDFCLQNEDCPGSTCEGEPPLRTCAKAPTTTSTTTTTTTTTAGTTRRMPICGNRIIEDDETCDDGNSLSFDGCSSTCRREPGWVCKRGDCTKLRSRCGDGLVVGKEQCDDGNKRNGDGCNRKCKVEEGFECTLREQKPQSQCALTTTTTPEATTTTSEETTTVLEESTTEVESSPSSNSQMCGNGDLDDGEECDDENADSGDGCSSNCMVEAGWYCVDDDCRNLETRCGDGFVAGDEECDDGNPSRAGDGCGKRCKVMSGFTCIYRPGIMPESLCFPTPGL